MDISTLSLTEENEYAVRNILQSLHNAKIYCSYLDRQDLSFELENMIERIIKRAEKKINDNF